MAEIEQNFRMKAGNKKLLSFVIEGIDNFAGLIVKWGFSEASHTDNIVTKSLPGTGVEINAPIISVTLMPDDTKSVPRGRYYHELWIEDAIGGRKTLAVGQLLLRDSIFK